MALDVKMISSVYERFCIERFELPSEDQITHIETVIGVRLPEDYRNYLAHFNGGYFSEPDIVPASPQCPLDCLTFMHGVGVDDANAGLANDIDVALFDDNYPAQVLPIGYTITGGLILLVTHADANGSIRLKVIDREEAYFLARDISELFSLIQEHDDTR